MVILCNAETDSQFQELQWGGGRGRGFRLILSPISWILGFSVARTQGHSGFVYISCGQTSETCGQIGTFHSWKIV